MSLKCTRCDGTGFLNVDQLPETVNRDDPAAISDWLAEHPDPRILGNCSCHISPPCWVCSEAHDVAVCDCCGDGESHYGIPGQHYSDEDPKGPNGPYAENGGLCECH